MASVPIPEQAAKHLWAMLLLFNGETSGRLLDEAEQLAAEGRTAPAVIIAGTVLEYLLRSPAVKLWAASRKSEFDAWRRLRDQAAHGLPMSPHAEEAHRMLRAVREMVTEPAPQPSGPRREFAAHIKGKYGYVHTSADEFMKRKREEVELEDGK